MPEQDYLPEFEFLPNLPKSNLDDRTFNDLVQECLLRIPRYCPEWTNHNPSDPGITLVEMFAWLTDQMLYRFNQVPRRYYVAFLELLGIRLQSAVPARADLTFYLTKAQSDIKCIPKGIEVATIRTETQQAVVFTTDKDLIIGQPKIKYLLTSNGYSHNLSTELSPARGFVYQAESPSNFNNIYHVNNDGSFQDVNFAYLLEDSQPGNCFYLVLEAILPIQSTSALAIVNQGDTLQNSITGNVLALTFKGTAAATTGINPDDPPLLWQAWNGREWVDGILRQNQDDKTKGFSFHQIGQPLQGADIILHLPQEFPVVTFGSYEGHWVRCVYEPQPNSNELYLRSPEISSIEVRAIGGQVCASECVRVESELLGVSDGKPGQLFQLQGYPVLKREVGEGIQVILPGGEVEDWQEVQDFADSGLTDKHYIIDSRTGEVQFGPLVREPNQMVQQISDRASADLSVRRLRQRSREISEPTKNIDNYLEWQYGAIPPIGAEIRMKSYRVGGGIRGNVAKNQLTVLRTAIPYVKNITNYLEGRGGKEAESLNEAVMRVPQILRTSETAIAAEDFENIAQQNLLVYRAYCPPCDSPGYVRVLIVPDPRDNNLSEVDFCRLFPEGIKPDEHLKLEAELKEELENKFNQHKSLGIKVEADEPDYVGMKIIAEVFLEQKYNKREKRNEMHDMILKKLYFFLNPITGGLEQKGWSLGNSVKISDIVAFLQNMPEIGYVGQVQIFSIRKSSEQNEWLLKQNPELIINPGKLGLICAWKDENSEFNSIVNFLD
jgi:predicted phage baseplate assembly protein